MRRRDFITLLSSAMAVARPLHAQQEAMPVIGFLNAAAPSDSAPFMPALHQGLGESAYVVGQNLAMEYRWAEGHYDRLPALAADLVGRKVDVIVAFGGGPARAAKSATSTIPIVFAGVGDPVEQADASSSWRWHHAMPFRRTISGASSRRPAA
jgi:putative ABC transport system substrate-binding protein